MDYEQKYKDALERAKDLISRCKSNRDRRTMIYRIEDIEHIFSELKEFEDERIRKRIIALVNAHGQGMSKESMLAWLEKQGEKDKLIKELGEYKVKYTQEVLSQQLKKQGEKSSTFAWHSVSEAPDEMRELLCEWETDDAIWHDVAFYDAKTNKFRQNKMPIDNVTRWTYIDELLEKQGERKSTDNLTQQEAMDIAVAKCFDEQNPAVKVEPKFKVGDTMRTLQEASDGITSGLPVVVSIDNEYYHCTNELIAIKNQDDYEYPPMNSATTWSEEDEEFLRRAINATKDVYPMTANWLKSLKQRIGG